MLMLVRALVGLGSLFMGRLLFWLFVGAAGFAAGVDLAVAFLENETAGLIVVVGLIAGLLGAVLALLAERLAIGLAGFVAGGYLLRYLVDLVLAGELSMLVSAVVFILGGTIGTILLLMIFEVALIILSSILGAALLLQVGSAAGLGLSPSGEGLLFVLLTVVGIGVQWGFLRREEVRGRREQRVE